MLQLPGLTTYKKWDAYDPPIYLYILGNTLILKKALMPARRHASPRRRLLPGIGSKGVLATPYDTRALASYM